MRVSISGIPGVQVKKCQVAIPRNALTAASANSIIFTRRGRSFGLSSVLIGNRLWENVPASLVHELKQLESAVRQIGNQAGVSKRDLGEDAFGKRGYKTTINLKSRQITDYESTLGGPAHELLIGWLKQANAEINARAKVFEGKPPQRRFAGDLISFDEYL